MCAWKYKVNRTKGKFQGTIILSKLIGENQFVDFESTEQFLVVDYIGIYRIIE